MILANDMMNQPLNVTGLTPEQIEQVQTIIEAFKATNQLEQIQQNITERQASNVNKEEININDLFFTSEILAPFNRSMLYGQRI